MKTKHILMSALLATAGLSVTSCQEASADIKPDPVDDGGVIISKQPVSTLVSFDAARGAGDIVNIQLDYIYDMNGDLAELIQYTPTNDPSVTAVKYHYLNGRVMSEQVLENGALVTSQNYSYDSQENRLSDLYDYKYQNGQVVMAIEKSTSDTFDIKQIIESGTETVSVVGRKPHGGVVDSTVYEFNGNTVKVYSRLYDRFSDENSYSILRTEYIYDNQRVSSAILNSAVTLQGIFNEDDEVLVPSFINSNFAVKSVSSLVEFVHSNGSNSQDDETATIIKFEKDQFGRLMEMEYNLDYSEGSLIQKSFKNSYL